MEKPTISQLQAQAHQLDDLLVDKLTADIIRLVEVLDRNHGISMWKSVSQARTANSLADLARIPDELANKVAACKATKRDGWLKLMPSDEVAEVTSAIISIALIGGFFDVIICMTSPVSRLFLPKHLFGLPCVCGSNLACAWSSRDDRPR